MDHHDLAYSLFNQYLFQDAKNNIEHIEYYFQINPNTASNRLIQEFIHAIKSYDLSAIGRPLFDSILTRTNKNQAEREKIIHEITKWKGYTKEQMLPARQMIQDICANSVIRRANLLHKDRPAEYLKYLKNANFKTNDPDVLSTVGFNELDINTIIAEESSDGIPSHYGWINETFQPNNRIERSQMIMVSMPPGCGKSLFAMSEAMYMAARGYKVHYLAMGDLNMKDFVIRMSTMWSGLSFASARANIASIYESITSVVGDNLSVTIVPAGSITVDDYIEFIKDQDFEVLFVDYDSNFKSAGSENMYSEYGEIYEKLTYLTGLGKIVYVLAQPKVNKIICLFTR